RQRGDHAVHRVRAPHLRRDRGALSERVHPSHARQDLGLLVHRLHAGAVRWPLLLPARDLPGDGGPAHRAAPLGGPTSQRITLTFAAVPAPPGVTRNTWVPDARCSPAPNEAAHAPPAGTRIREATTRPRRSISCACAGASPGSTPEARNEPRAGFG